MFVGRARACIEILIRFEDCHSLVAGVDELFFLALVFARKRKLHRVGMDFQAEAEVLIIQDEDEMEGGFYSV